MKEKRQSLGLVGVHRGVSIAEEGIGDNMNDFMLKSINTRPCRFIQNNESLNSVYKLKSSQAPSQRGPDIQSVFNEEDSFVFGTHNLKGFALAQKAQNPFFKRMNSESKRDRSVQLPPSRDEPIQPVPGFHEPFARKPSFVSKRLSINKNIVVEPKVLSAASLKKPIIARITDRVKEEASLSKAAPVVMKRKVRTPGDYRQMIIECIYERDCKRLKRLLEAEEGLEAEAVKAALGMSDMLGNIPLDIACKVFVDDEDESERKIVKLLLDKGSDFTHRDEANNEPLHNTLLSVSYSQ